ncbi:serine hydrolase domain-containing protein [Streptomyces sp. NPDC048172]|uniref:serine hydrolase domain-containing protein n=1 Tax=Streptomyces sp. NPDC048172 TaxID=3365505 RepID=UPI003715AFFE
MPLRLPLCVHTPRSVRAEHGHDPDRYVQIGSLTKPLTGTLLSCLARAGRIGWDDPVEKWLDAPSGTGITLRHLALHTSGLPRLPPQVPGRRADPYAAFDAEALGGGGIARLSSLVLRPPGAQEEYSNFGYAVLGAALEAAGEDTYEELLRTHVLRPLGVDDGRVTARPPAGDAVLPPRGRWGRRRSAWTMSGAVLPAGGLWATPRALAEVVTGLLVRRTLGEPSLSWTRSGPGYWHDGSTGGYATFAAVRDDGRWAVVSRIGGRADTANKIGLQALVSQPRPER